MFSFFSVATYKTSVVQTQVRWDQMSPATSFSQAKENAHSDFKGTVSTGLITESFSWCPSSACLSALCIHV